MVATNEPSLDRLPGTDEEPLSVNVTAYECPG